MTDVLNPNNFWNVVFITGVIMTILYATPITIPRPGGAMVIRVPPRKQKAFLILGVSLIATSLIGFSIKTSAEIFSPARKSPDEFSRELPIDHSEGALDLSIVPSAFAQGTEGQEVAHFRLVQRRAIKLTTQFEGEIGVYLGDVHLVDPSRVVLFKASDQGPRQGRVEYEEFMAVTTPESIITNTLASDGKRINFAFKDKNYHMTVHFKWYLVGEDYGDFKVFLD